MERRVSTENLQLLNAAGIQVVSCNEGFRWESKADGAYAYEHFLSHEAAEIAAVKHVAEATAEDHGMSYDAWNSLPYQQKLDQVRVTWNPTPEGAQDSPRGALFPEGWQDDVVPEWRIESDAMCASVLDQDGDRVCYCDSGDAEYDERNAKLIVRSMHLLPHFARLADFVETVAMGNTDIEDLERMARELGQDLARLVETGGERAQPEAVKKETPRG